MKLHNIEIDSFTLAYLECALWSSFNPSALEGSEENLDRSNSLEDIPKALLEEMVSDCKDFQESNAELLAQAGDNEQNGHDFWLTREGHGAGFWDRGYSSEVGDGLTEASKVYGSGSDSFFQYEWKTEEND